jgi:quinol monooxygenase YgiN
MLRVAVHMITIQQRWFVPSEKIEEFGVRWVSEILPALMDQPGFLRAEVYESHERGHWVTVVSWQDQQSLSEAAEHLAELYKEFEQYERFAPETLEPLTDDLLLFAHPAILH